MTSHPGTGAKTMRKKEDPCLKCKGICCRYVALPIDNPESKDDFDDIRWYIAHKGVWVFVEDEDWYVCFNAKCEFLDKNNRCSIYETRPKICRGYKTDECEFLGEGEAYDMKFTRIDEIEKYAKDFLREKRKKKAKKKSKKKKP